MVLDNSAIGFSLPERCRRWSCCASEGPHRTNIAADKLLLSRRAFDMLSICLDSNVKFTLRIVMGLRVEWGQRSIQLNPELMQSSRLLVSSVQAFSATQPKSPAYIIIAPWLARCAVLQAQGPSTSYCRRTHRISQIHDLIYSPPPPVVSGFSDVA
ncbi:hypothetical protein BV22DRAFT_614509 [Leucogyrophana mollusca]|uniref:Uncharacterized protein n=1 Tax=Leucogyrophana mollusca TaxID=85980 RepID=A0ACB8BBD4_9AGAM|nr:hypothetical protein BV22DRAFT_614509 [Leucogyrophana mollusca]